MQNTDLCSSLHGPVPLMLSAALCVVQFCGAMLSAYAVMQSLCELASAGCLCEQVPLQQLCPCAESRLCLWGVCVLLPQGHWGCSWLATQVALAALN